MTSRISTRGASAAGAVLAAFLIQVGPAQAGFLSTFSSGIDGWSGVAFTEGLIGNPPAIVAGWTPTFHATGGASGGYISAGDTYTNLMGPWDFWSAPSSYLGSMGAYYGGTLAFDLFSSPVDSDTSTYPEVLLIGNGMALYHVSGAAPGTTWTSYSISLIAADWRLGSPTGTAPTVAEMQAVLASLTGLYIDADWYTGAQDEGLDNVRFDPGPAAPVDEPSTLPLALSGLAALMAASVPRSLARLRYPTASRRLP